MFWVGTLLAGALAPGYSVRSDFVSSLAGRGSSVAVLGTAALVALALAHLAAGVAVAGGTRAVAGGLLLAGAFGLTVAAFRTGCPLGAAGCGFGANDAPADLADLVHGYGVLGYEVAIVVAMLLVVAGFGRESLGWRLLTVTAAVASVVLLLQTGGVDNGLWQRAWLAVNTAWLVTLVASPPGSRKPADQGANVAS